MPLIVFEGIDGSGKDTQIKKTSALLKSSNTPFSIHKYPTKTAAHIHSYLSGKITLSTRTRFFLYLLDIFLEQGKLKQELESGKTVILDRYIFSTIAYSQDPPYVEAESTISSFSFLPPDKVFLLDLPPELSQSRKKKQKILDVHESDIKLLSTVRKNYLALCSSRFLCETWVKVDSSKKPEEVFAEIEKHLKK